VQEENAENYRFLQRAKKLKEMLGFISDEALAEAIKISPKTYYNCIKDTKITDKTWRKLEAAEIAAGLRDSPASTAPSPRPSDQSSSPAAAEELPGLGKPLLEQFQSLETRLAALEQKTDEMLKLLKGLKR